MMGNRVKASHEYFDPETLASISSLGLRARTVVEGFLSGMHRSPLRGSSIEFANHREYVFGDDLRTVDWNVFARTDRYYVKQYEDETSLTCNILLDQSQSMHYQGKTSPLSKLEYAQLIACTLTYLVVTHQDRAGLVAFSESIDDWLQPSSSTLQFDEVVRLLNTASPKLKTDVAGTIKQVVSNLRRPGLLVVISDLLESPEPFCSALRLARLAGHDVMVISVLDKDEVQFPFDSATQFEGLEEMGRVVTDPVLIGGAYRAAMEAHQHALRKGCGQLGVDYFQVQTDRRLSSELPPILASRQLRKS